MSEIATAYVQIEPTAKGISGKISNLLGNESESAGSSAGASFSGGFSRAIGGLGKVVAGAAAAGTAAVVGLSKEAISAYSDFEQLEGGTKLLFGSAYDTVMKNAESAFSRVQMSTNDYLTQANGYATGLKEALGNDAEAAANLADRIMVAQADVVAATGTSAEAVSNAFAGVMKNNFSMLDNLQLGIKPTKEGMQEVIDQMNELNNTEYEMGNLADMQSAIVDYITYVGMAGYAQKEASGTIQGSLASMSAAWQNVLAGMGNSGADLGGLIDKLLGTVKDFVNNIKPIISQVLVSVATLIAELAPVLAEELPALLQSVLPMLLESGVTIIQTLAEGILGALPTLLPSIVEIVITLADMLISMLPQLIEVGMQVILQLAMGIAQALPTLIPTIIAVILTIVQYLIDNIDLLVDAAIQLMIGLTQGLIEALPILIEKIPEIVVALVQAIIENAPLILEAIIQVCQMLIETAVQYLSPLVERAGEIMRNVIDAVKTWLSQLPERMAYFAGEAVAKFVNFMVMLPSRIIAVFRDLITSAQDFGSNFMQQAAEFATGFGNRLIEGLKSLPEKLITVGHNIVEGLKEGIARAWESLTGWVGNLVSNLVKGFTDNLEIDSPSKVFRDDVGIWIPAGIAEGIEDGMGAIDTAMADVTADLLPDQMNMVTSYTPTSESTTQGSQLYGLLSKYLPMIAEGGNVNVALEGDAQGLFNLVRQQNKIYKRMSGESAFA